MALSKKQRHKLKLAGKRRDRRPEPTITVAPSMSVKRSERDRLTNSNPEMMMSLESLLIGESERNAEIDDAILAKALRMVVRSKEPTAATVQVVVESLQRWQSDQDDAEQTQLAMRVIHESIETRSDCQPGTRSYIAYASRFIRRAR